MQYPTTLGAQEEAIELSDADALPVLLRAMEAGGGLARFLPLPPDAAAWLDAARALACVDPAGGSIRAPAADGERPEGAGAPARAGRAVDASGAGTSMVRAAAGAAGDPAASASGAAEPCAPSAAWPDLSDAALLTWPAGALAAAGHLAGVRSRAQLQRIDWAAVLRCAARPFASLAVVPCVKAIVSMPVSSAISNPGQDLCEAKAYYHSMPLKALAACPTARPELVHCRQSVRHYRSANLHPTCASVQAHLGCMAAGRS